MDWLQFIASLISSLAWPSVLVTALLIFRRHLLALAPYLREVEAAGVKLKFEQGLEQVKSDADASPSLPVAPAPALGGPLGLGQPADQSVPLMLAVHAPRALVLESWASVEHALRAAVGDTGSPAKSRPPNRILDELRSTGRVTPEIAKIVDDLRRLRNEAAHLPTFAIETDKALEYYRLARRVTEALGGEPLN